MQYLFTYDLLMDKNIISKKFPSAQPLGIFKLDQPDYGIYFDVKFGDKLVLPNLGFDSDSPRVYGMVWSINDDELKKYKPLKNQILFELKATPITRTFNASNLLIKSLKVVTFVFKVDILTRQDYIPAQNYLKKLLLLMKIYKFPEIYIKYIIDKSRPKNKIKIISQ